MLKIYIAVLTIITYVHSHPLETHSQSSSSNGLHLIVNNSTKSLNYKLTPIMEELEDIDEEINKELESILPYIRFMFDSLFGNRRNDEDECMDDMIIQLVPDTSDRTLPPKDNIFD